jgi:hypothetical protein
VGHPPKFPEGIRDRTGPDCAWNSFLFELEEKDIYRRIIG